MYSKNGIWFGRTNDDDSIKYVINLIVILFEFNFMDSIDKFWSYIVRNRIFPLLCVCLHTFHVFHTCSSFRQTIDINGNVFVIDATIKDIQIEQKQEEKNK